MKIQTSVKLTVDECVNLAVERLKEVYGDDCVVDIERPMSAPPDGVQLVLDDSSLPHLIRDELGDRPIENKIPAIRAVRAWFNKHNIYCGLALAKKLVELKTNPEQF